MTADKPNYLILGAGLTGLSCANYFLQSQTQFTLFDTRPDLDHKRLGNQIPCANIVTGDWTLLNISLHTHCIISPGFDPSHPIISELKTKQIPIEGDINYFARHTDKPLFAVTGTNGKSTVVTLVGEMAKKSGVRIGIGGNIGTPMMDLLAKQNEYYGWGLELSSFQLETVSDLTPTIATILNVSDDHMDRYDCFNDYVSAKQRIYHHSELCLYNRDDINTKPPQDKNSTSFGLDKPSCDNDWGIANNCIVQGNQMFITIEDIKLQGKHNWLNAMAAAAIAQSMGIDQETIVQVLSCFEGLPHRCQLVIDNKGIKWINDSKGTNVGATVSALLSLEATIKGSIILIAGGQAKEADLSPLKETINNWVKDLILIGADKTLFEQELSSYTNCHPVNSMDEAVKLAHQLANSGDMVLLSPACASFDMFNNFEHRGEVFTQSVKGLLCE